MKKKMKLYGTGYRNCYNGITWGWSRPIGKGSELVILEYRRVSKRHDKELIVKTLHEKLMHELRDAEEKNMNESAGFGKTMNRRMKKWTRQLADYFESLGK